MSGAPVGDGSVDPPMSAKELKAQEAERKKQEKLELVRRKKEEEERKARGKLEEAKRAKEEKERKAKEKAAEKQRAKDAKKKGDEGGNKVEDVEMQVAASAPAPVPAPAPTMDPAKSPTSSSHATGPSGRGIPPPPPPANHPPTSPPGSAIAPPPPPPANHPPASQLGNSSAPPPPPPAPTTTKAVEKGGKPLHVGPPATAAPPPAVTTVVMPPPLSAPPAAYVPPPPRPEGNPGKRKRKEMVLLKAKFAYDAQQPDEISIKRGMRLFGLELMENEQWWYGEVVGSRTRTRGLFPANFVEAVDPRVRRQLDPSSGGAPAAAGGAGATAGGGAAAEGRAPVVDTSKLKLTFYAHNLGYGASLACVLLCLLAAYWWSEGSQGDASQLKQSSLFTVIYVWIYGIGVGVWVFLFEYSHGLKRVKAENPLVSPRGIAYLCAGIPLWVGYPTMLAAGLMTTTGLVNMVADFQREEGDGTSVKGNYGIIWWEKSDSSKAPVTEGEELTWLEKARERGTVGQNLIVVVYLGINVIIMANAAVTWVISINLSLQTCVPQSSVCPGCCPSIYAAWAKTFGQMLNWNSSMILLPVLRSLLRWANNYQISPTKSLAAYIPLRKNIIFHKLIASLVAIGALGHVLFHFINFAIAPEFTLWRFGPYAWFTGTLITYSMFIIYAGAQNRVKRANYEVFFVSHHAFVIFQVMLLAHGPNYFAYACVPLTAYVAERLYRLSKGHVPFYLRRALYIPPVMELSFFPEVDSKFVFREGQYLYLLAPHLSAEEWHPFTISSSFGDLEVDREVTVHIRIQGDKSWTRRLMEYLSLMTHSSKKKGEAFVLELEHYDNNGERQIGKYLGPDGLPIIAVDGPHAAPAQHYSEFQEVMLVGAGIGLTPSSAILKAVLRHKWKKGFLPNALYFYWVVNHKELESFRWFVNLLVELEKRVVSDLHAGALLPTQYLEMNIYVTGAPKPGQAVTQPRKLDMSFSQSRALNVGFDVDIGFDEESLMRALLNPTLNASKQASLQTHDAGPMPGRFLHTWIWNGRPAWPQIFECVRDQRTPSVERIATVFCGTPVIGKDLKRLCVEYSDIKKNLRFQLFKENF